MDTAVQQLKSGVAGFTKIALKFVLDSLGQPASFKQMLIDNTALRFEFAGKPTSVSSSEVVRWHDWHKSDGSAQLMGWRKRGSEYGNYYVTIDALSKISYRERVEHWECEIQSVEGLSASKSDLRTFGSLDEMAEERVQYLTGEVTHANLEKSLAWSEIRIIHRDTNADWFEWHQWDGRIFLMNDGGSHHFAAGRYLASRLGETVPLKGLLVRNRLRPEAIAELLSEYELFVINNEPAALEGFYQAMRKYGAGFLFTPMPRPYKSGRVILLPRSDVRAMNVASLLREAGHADLGAHLIELSRHTPELPQFNLAANLRS